MAVPTYTKMGSGSSKTSGTSLAITNTSTSYAVGDYVTAAFWCDPASGTVSFAKSGGTATVGTWVVPSGCDVANGSGTSGVRLVFSYAPVTGAGTVTGVTVTHPSLAARGGEIGKVTGADGTTPIMSTGQSGLVGGALATVTAGRDVLYLGVLGMEAVGATTLNDGAGGTPAIWDAGATPDANWTTTTYDNSSIGTTGGGAASNISGGVAAATRAATVSQTASFSYGPTTTPTGESFSVLFQAPAAGGAAASLVYADRRVRLNPLLRR